MTKNKMVWLGVPLVVVVSFVGGIIGGFLGVGVLDEMLFGVDRSREVILQESSAIIDVVNQLEPSVVNITSEGAPRYDIFGREFEGRGGAGTGIIISEDGLIITNKHVVPENSRIAVTLYDDTFYEDVEVIARDPFNDIAYLRIDSDEDLMPAELGDSDQVMVGQKVVAIGNVLGRFSNTVTTGIISAIGRPVIATGDGIESESLEGLFQTDAAINPGNSGGPLVNIQGQVIAINTAVAGGAENIGFAIPINQAKGGIASILESGRLIKPFLGVRYITLNSQIAQNRDIDINEGALLVGDDEAAAIVEGSPAEAAGLEAGDVIIKVDDVDVDRKQPLSVILGRYKAGDNIELVVIRGGEELNIGVVLAEFDGF
ncbi:MAG: trypsin-like peptidase domain-containing protein [Candidatus Saccharimonadales bacterium]